MTAAGAEQRDTVVVPLSGELDMAVAEEMRQRLGDGLQPGTRRVAVDFGAVTFIDSSAIGELLQFRLGCEAAGVGLVLRSVPGNVRRVLEIANLMSTFDVVDEAEPESSAG
jgi:anti-anti-sigma factor